MDGILTYADDLANQMRRFDKAEAVAAQWLQHRHGERALLEAEYGRLRDAARGLGVDADLRALKTVLDREQVHLCVHKKVLFDIDWPIMA
jgi:hypothetical protein